MTNDEGMTKLSFASWLLPVRAFRWRLKSRHGPPAIPHAGPVALGPAGWRRATSAPRLPAAAVPSGTAPRGCRRPPAATAGRAPPIGRRRGSGRPAALRPAGPRALAATEVEFHLSLVGGLEPAELQVDGHQPPQPPVVEEEVEVVVLVVHRDPLLPGDKGEIRAEFQQERLQFPQDGLLHVAFAVESFSPRKSST